MPAAASSSADESRVSARRYRSAMSRYEWDLVVTSEGGPTPPIISAWRASKRERREYEER